MNISGGKGFIQKNNEGKIYNADIINIHQSKDSEKSKIYIDWRNVCEAMLKNQQESQKLRCKATEMGFEVNIYLPLGLVERKQQPRRSQYEDVKLGEIYQVEEEAIAQIYEHDEFLQEVIAQTPRKKNQHVAIVGEPGAGKTTLLSAIASFLFNQNLTPQPGKGEILAIFISLVSLQGRTLEDYILKTWLSEAIGLVHPEIEITLEVESQLKQQFRQGGVWLLLDGVDEMGLDSSGKALGTIQKQLTSWLIYPRVVLTCRLNVWDASLNNPLNNFDTYKTQDFQSEDIDKFIKKWFECANLPERGEQLQAKLRETGREPICELVKNPLRLSLLCQIFYVDKQAELPKTKAGLYHKFTRYFYGWKQTDVENQPKVQQELHYFLGKLALAGINSVARFRFSESLAIEEMGEKLFKLACNLGWLNLVNRDTETDEPIYAFFHPTFQEYFAAHVIEDWDFFLPRKHKNKPIKDKPYRIFEPQWKEVILLWLGREDDTLKQQKEQFINALVKFQDRCNDFYRYRAYFLAAAGIGEFKDYPHAYEIVTSIVAWSFNKLIAEKAKAAIQETDRTKVIVLLVELIKNFPNEEIRKGAVINLGETGKDNPRAITALIELITNSQYGATRDLAAISLWKIGKNSPTAIAALIELIKNSQDKYTRIRAATSLMEVGQDNPTAIAALVELIKNSQDEYTRRLAATSLIEVGKDNPTAIAALVELITNSQDEYIRRLAAYSLGEVSKDNPTVIAALVELITNSQDEYTRALAAYSLGEVGKDNPTAIAALVELIKNSQDEYTRRLAAYSLEQLDKDNPVAIANSEEENARKQALISLGQIDKDNPTLIATLIELIVNSQDEDTRGLAAYSLNQSLKQIDNGQTTIKTLVELITNCQDEDTSMLAATSLMKVGKDNPTAIAALVELITNSQDEYTRRLAATSLMEVGKDNPTAIAALVELITNSQDEYTRGLAAYSLGEVGKDNPTAIKALVELIANSQNEDTRGLAAYSLGEVGKDNPTVIKVLVKLIKNSQDEYTRGLAAHSLQRCTESLPYPEFYHAYQQGRGGVVKRLINFYKRLF